MRRIVTIMSLMAVISIALKQIPATHEEIVQKLKAYTQNFPQEKLYLQLDKPYYSNNEDLWVKAYLVDAFNPSLPPVSNVIDVELINEKQEVVAQRKIKLENQGGAGHIFLPDTLKPGKYALQAYTNWSRNFDESFLFTKTFEILDTYNEESGSISTIESSEIDVAFFPEGGELIYGVPTIIGFKALDHRGLGIEIEGQVLNQDGYVATSIKTLAKGMGRFILTPQHNQSYTSSFIYQGETHTFNLPEIKKTGYAIKATHSYESEKVILGVYAKGVSLEGGFLLGHQNGQEFLRIFTGSKGLSANINKADFPAGICQLTFFDGDGIPRSERIVTVNLPTVKETIKLGGIETYSKREKVDLKLGQVSDSNQQWDYQNLSISITPRDQILIHPLQQNIRNFLQLSSDLKGHIEDPEFYFGGTKGSYELLENLMLTQGWRRFKWEEVLSEDDQLFDFLPERSLTFQGQISNNSSGRNPVRGKVQLSIMDEAFSFLESETNEKGQFLFDGIEFYDSTQLLFEGKRIIGRNGKEKDNVFVQISPKVPLPFREIDFSDQSYNKERIASFLKQRGKINQIDQAFTLDDDLIILDEVQIEAVDEVALQKDFKEYGMLYKQPSNRLVLDSIPGTLTGISIFDYLQGRIPGIRILGPYPNQTIAIRTTSNLRGNLAPPLFLVDGVPVDAGVISSMSPSDVVFIDILRGPKTTIYGPQAFGGVLAVYTKNGAGANLKPYVPPKNTLKIIHPGFSVAKEFYTPNYDVVDYSAAKPDYRSTLYWNPNILIQQDTVSLAFYTSDQEGVFDIIIEGITSSGDPVYKREVMYIE